MLSSCFLHISWTQNLTFSVLIIFIKFNTKKLSFLKRPERLFVVLLFIINSFRTKFVNKNHFKPKIVFLHLGDILNFWKGLYSGHLAVWLTIQQGFLTFFTLVNHYVPTSCHHPISDKMVTLQIHMKNYFTLWILLIGVRVCSSPSYINKFENGHII